jgi:hypothetical protein
VLTRFKGEIVVLGEDEDGDEITTMILSLDDCGGTGDGKPNTNTKPSPTELRAMSMLYDALNDHAKDAPNNSFPFGVKVVPLDTWRDFCKRGGISKGESDSAFRTAFQRVSISLANKRKIGLLDGFVWVVRD